MKARERERENIYSLTETKSGEDFNEERKIYLKFNIEQNDLFARIRNRLLYDSSIRKFQLVARVIARLEREKSRSSYDDEHILICNIIKHLFTVFASDEYHRGKR